MTSVETLQQTALRLRQLAPEAMQRAQESACRASNTENIANTVRSVFNAVRVVTAWLQSTYGNRTALDTARAIIPRDTLGALVHALRTIGIRGCMDGHDTPKVGAAGMSSMMECEFVTLLNCCYVLSVLYPTEWFYNDSESPSDCLPPEKLLQHAPPLVAKPQLPLVHYQQSHVYAAWTFISDRTYSTDPNSSSLRLWRNALLARTARIVLFSHRVYFTSMYELAHPEWTPLHTDDGVHELPTNAAELLRFRVLDMDEGKYQAVDPKDGARRIVSAGYAYYLAATYFRSEAYLWGWETCVMPLLMPNWIAEAQVDPAENSATPSTSQGTLRAPCPEHTPAGQLPAFLEKRNELFHLLINSMRATLRQQVDESARAQVGGCQDGAQAQQNHLRILEQKYGHDRVDVDQAWNTITKAIRDSLTSCTGGPAEDSTKESFADVYLRHVSTPGKKEMYRITRYMKNPTNLDVEMEGTLPQAASSYHRSCASTALTDWLDPTLHTPGDIMHRIIVTHLFRILLDSSNVDPRFKWDQEAFINATEIHAKLLSCYRDRRGRFRPIITRRQEPVFIMYLARNVLYLPIVNRQQETRGSMIVVPTVVDAITLWMLYVLLVGGESEGRKRCSWAFSTGRTVSLKPLATMMYEIVVRTLLSSQ